MLGFDPLDFPLQGQRLIEASAGTGKTYSIALLFLRLLLERKLDVDQILVITFTRAATDELRSRIGLRLREALDHLDDAQGGENEDDLLTRLISGIEDRQEARTRLFDALVRMDESAIYTIHGFCQRMLQDNAFESGAFFEFEFLESEQPLRSRIMEDFWRRSFYSSPPEEAEWASSEWKDPAGLEKSISGVLANAFVEYIPEVAADEVQQAREEAQRFFRRMCGTWRENSSEIEDILRHYKCLSRNKRDGYSPRWVETILAWQHSLQEDAPMSWVLPRHHELLGATVMQGKLIGKKILPQHLFFQEYDAFAAAHAAFCRAARFQTLTQARRFMVKELAIRKDNQARIYYDDLLVKLDRALADKGAPALVRRIRSRFAAALIDEFQDTDPVQYRIASKLFGREPDPALFMIGDPKQSIYSFRGADIFTYIKARRDTPATGRFTMKTNYRSTSAMIQAVNTLFQPRDSFVFKPDIVFHPVSAGGKADKAPMLLEGETPMPLQAMLIPPDAGKGDDSAVVSKTRAEEIATRWAAYEIARLLSLGAEGKATLDNENLTGGDLAVLVRTHHEAYLMQQALGSLNIASVYYSQDSVFTTREAKQLYLVLFGLLDLSDEYSTRNALITDLFGLNGSDLYQLQKSDSKRDALAAELQDYQQCWQKSGLMAMFQRMLAKRSAVQRLLAEPTGERKLTNYQHLVELLQEASLKLEGMDSLIRWFSDQLHNPEPAKANQQLRLESDENLVRIITIHKAKGLEYPVVFLPYLWRARPVKRDAVFSFHEPGTDRVLADLGTGNPDHYRLAEKERLAEDLRLLYVAITRARHMCFFCWGRINGMESTPLAWLLHRKETEAVPSSKMMDIQTVTNDLFGINSTDQLLENVPFPADFSRMFAGRRTTESTLRSKVFTGIIDSGWAMTSYSQLTASFAEPENAAMVSSGRTAAEPEEKKEFSVFGFPRGAAAGNCLHGILEQVDFADITEEELRELVDLHLAKTGISREWTTLVCHWMQDIIETRLSEASGLRLMDINREDRLAELGFYFSMQALDMDRINRVLTDFSIPPLVPASALAHKSGLMKGFVDLVFSSAGRFFIADYKSNYLGPEYADYTPQNLAEAMIEHRYDLQYLIYSVALHRYLGTRLSGYEYDSHFGGIYYLFLRGIQPASGPATGVFYARPERSLVERLDSCFGYPEIL